MITSLARSTIGFRMVALALAATLAAAGAAATTPAPAVAADGSENEGADCQVPGLPDAGSLPTVSRLPDPFTKLNGTRVTTKSDWRCRREEIKRLAEKFVYGEKPAKPSSVTGTVSRTGITVNVSHNGRTASFSAGVDLPSGTGPFPAVVVLGGFGADTAAIKAAGAAVITYDPPPRRRQGGHPAQQQAGRLLHDLRRQQLHRHTRRLGLGREPHHRRARTVRRRHPAVRRDRSHGLLALRQGRVRRRRVRPAHRAHHADRVGQRRRGRLPRHPG
ncbi:hypothetical protein GCM10020001_012080 [Nonomuraea salmonea]